MQLTTWCFSPSDTVTWYNEFFIFLICGSSVCHLACPAECSRVAFTAKFCCSMSVRALCISHMFIKHTGSLSRKEYQIIWFEDFTIKLFHSELWLWIAIVVWLHHGVRVDVYYLWVIELNADKECHCQRFRHTVKTAANFKHVAIVWSLHKMDGGLHVQRQKWNGTMKRKRRKNLIYLSVL